MNTWIEITLAPVIIGAVAFAVYVVLGSVIAMRRSLVEIQLLLDEYVTAITASPGLQDLKTPRTLNYGNCCAPGANAGTSSIAMIREGPSLV